VEESPLVYRTEVLSIIGALADVIVEIRAIRRLLEDALGWEEEEDPEGED
jgi:hypothetical protein